MKKVALFCIVILGMILLAGCVQTKLNMSLGENGQITNMVITVLPDLGYKDEANSYIWLLRYIFPNIEKDYAYSEEQIKTGYTTTLGHVFTLKKPIAITEMKNMKFERRKDGTYYFESKIAKLLKDEPSSTEEVILKLTITFPKEVDIATTPYINGKTATWNITSEMLYKGAVLKAITK